MRISPTLLCGSLAFVLIASAAVQLRNINSNAVTNRDTPLAELLPSAYAGWSARDFPIADTEEMKRSVDENLNFSEALFRRYTKGQTDISVYVAFWAPGRYHPRLIASHIPDYCWVGAGWNMDDSKTTEAYSVDTRETLLGEHRVFRRNQVVQYVTYWHLVGAQRSLYSQSNLSAIDTFLATFWQDLTKGQREQYFIRISSNRSLDDLASQDLLREILKSLQVTGLFGPR